VTPPKHQLCILDLFAKSSGTVPCLTVFALAHQGFLCFIPHIQVQPKRRPFGLGAPGKSALAGLLSLLLFLATTLSVSPALHQSLHLQDGANAHLCLMCSLAKGQVSAAESTLILILVVLAFLFSVSLATASPVAGFAYSPSQSRAPPRS
jgi:hypothetical protein